MNYYLKLDSSQVVWGTAYADKSPWPDGVKVDFNADSVLSLPTKQRLVDGALVDTGQPVLPPHPWMKWDENAIAWIDLRNLDDLKADQWAKIKAARGDAEFGGFTWDGSPFDSDAISQQRIIGASQLAGITPGFLIDWTLADNTVRTLNATDMQAVGFALGQHVNAQHVKARGLRQQIDDATTPAEVEAVVW